jgi:hypothetical protein
MLPSPTLSSVSFSAGVTLADMMVRFSVGVTRGLGIVEGILA